MTTGRKSESMPSAAPDGPDKMLGPYFIEIALRYENEVT